MEANLSASKRDPLLIFSWLLDKGGELEELLLCIFPGCVAHAAKDILRLVKNVKKRVPPITN